MKQKLRTLLTASAVSMLALPAFAADTAKPKTTEPDNSARNVRERDARTKTPVDQGNSKEDVATTAQIRKEITATKGMSVNARNVKVITNTGKVTLRGPVNTAEEKRVITAIANRIVKAENVDDQLEVKAASSSN